MTLRFLAAFILTGLAACGPAFAAQTEAPVPKGKVYVNPDWKRRPTVENLITVFPREAMAKGISGKAAISCTVTVQGALKDCTVISESPANMGFGGAAIALTPQFMMKPATLDGVPVESTARLPINFILPAGGMGSMLGTRRVVSAALPWVEAPSYAALALAYPAKAREAGLGGRATLSCGLGEDGRLKNCQLADAQPAGKGFDVAAKVLARQFRFAVTTDADRKATRDISVHLPVTFDPSTLAPGTPVIGKPKWASLPTSEAMTTAFAGINIQGTARAALVCNVEQGGGVSGCTVASESPEGLGVGAAALRLVPGFRLTTWSEDGLPVVGGTIRIPLRYEGSPAAPTPPK